jgi:hypothetical protein
MEKLCASVDYQNAKTLMGHAQSTAGADETSDASQPAVKRDEEKPNPMRKSVADCLDELIPRNSLLRRSIRERNLSAS